MSTLTTDILALLDPGSPDTWPQGILAAADLRDDRAKLATQGRWGVVNGTTIATGVKQTSPGCFGFIAKIAEVEYDHCESGDRDFAEQQADADAEHIAAEANPAHAFAAVDRWRGVIERHRISVEGPEPWCLVDAAAWPCPDLTATADEARAYLQGGD